MKLPKRLLIFSPLMVNQPWAKTCEGGCTWWTHRFVDDALDGVVLDRSIADVDEAMFGDFADEAMLMADALDRTLGPSAPPESLARWSDVERDDETGPERVVLQRRVWTYPDGTTTWELAGWPGHHPVAQLRVEVQRRDPG